jgi:hypothetical protein
MIRIDKQEQIPEVPDVTVWSDDADSSLFYVLPSIPRFRLQNGVPVFKLIKYRLPIEREDKKKGGGFCFFDTELAVSDDKMKKLKDILDDRARKQFAALHLPGTPPEAKFGTLTYVRGTVGMLMEKDGILIEKVMGAGKPSLYGNNVASFAVELTPEGTSVFEAAMQGQGASMVSVVYQVYFWVKLPPLQATVWFNSSQFYSFYQKVDIDWDLWGDDSYREKQSEVFSESQSGGTQVDFDFVLPDPDQDKKLKDRIRDWAQRTLEDMVQKGMIESIAPVTDDKRKVPDGIEHLTRDISTTKCKSFNQTYRENNSVEWNLNPQGNLGTLTGLKDASGKALVWKDFSITIDADDPFFKTLNVVVQTNADFDRLKIFSIEVKIDYTVGAFHQGKELRFSKPDDVGQFATFIENNVWKYKYSYQVNFKGSAQAYQSPVIETDEKQLTINVDDTGVFIVDVAPGDLNFEQVTQAEVVLQYQDTANNVPLFEQQFSVTKDHSEVRVQKLILQPVRNPYRYKVKYFMKNGKEFAVDWVNGLSNRLFINDPFSETKTVGIRALGDLDKAVDTIFADFQYLDEANAYSQTTSVALSKSTPFIDWSFPVISATGGKVSYSGTIKYKNGTEENIPQTTAAKDTILIGPRIEDTLEVQVLPDLLDFSQVKLVKTSLKYEDAGNGISVQKDVIFHKGDAAVTWSIPLKDKTKKQYQWKAQFFLTAGATKNTDWATTGEPTLVLEVPA